MIKIKPLIITKEQIEKLVPDPLKKLSKIYEDWKKSVLKFGMSANVSSFEELGKVGLPSAKPPVFLPPFMRAGTLQHGNVDRTGGNLSLEGIDFPALLQLKTKSAFLHYSEFDSGGMIRVIERNFLQLASTIDPSVVKCTLIDLENLGGTFSLLAASVPDVEILTSSAEVDEFFRKLPGEFRHRSQVRGFEFEFVSDYNRANPDSSIPFHFVFISSFENDLNDSQKEFLSKILLRSNAAKAGIYFSLLLHKRKSFDSLSALEDTVSLFETGNSNATRQIELIDAGGLETGKGRRHAGYKFSPDTLSNQALKGLSAFCRAHLSKKAMDPVRISLPDEKSWPAEAWTKNSSEGLEIRIGKSRGEVIFFRLGCGEIVHNALIGGAVGTGKTNLLHAILMQALAGYSPDELSVSILDYKSGTEFGIYEGCPHLYALSLGSGTKFGLDLLKHFQTEMETRAKLFKKERVSNMKDFRQKSGAHLARHLVVIDEFQVLLGDKRNGEAAQAALEDLIRRGRSFGFNFILSSQTLRDCTLTGATISNMGCRVCLRLSERDCSDFLSVGNILPSTFEYPGQAVYNNSEGHTDGNIEFRSAFYTSGEIGQFLTLLGQKASQITNNKIYKPFIYKDSRPILKRDLQTSARPHHLLIAIEDGIQQAPVFSDLSPSAGPLVAVGTGTLREFFESNLMDELSGISPEKKLLITGPEIDAFCDQWQSNPAINEGVEILVFMPRPRDGSNFTFQNFLTTTIADALIKIVLIADNVQLLRSLCIDRTMAEILVCLDQRSYSEFGWDSLLTGQPLAAAVFLPGENDPKLVKIPKI